MELNIQEHLGTSRSYRNYSIKDNQIITNAQSVKQNIGIDWITRFVYSAFLPEGFPESVSADYLEYQKWDSIQALCSSVTGLLSTQAILKGVGVGDQTATAAGAALQWVVRDGTGMLGRILFAWFQGSNLDCNSKTWRFMADILNDLAMMIELLSPLAGKYFLPVICTAGVLKSIVGVAGGSTRAAITQHQSKRNNMADVSAKDGSQETAVSLLGMILGVLISPFLNSTFTIWLLFAIFTSLHLFANYRAVSCVVFQTLNQQRAGIIINAFLTAKTKNIPLDRTLITPKHIAAHERILTFDKKHFKLIFGSSISSLNCDATTIAKLLEHYKYKRYFIYVDLKTRRVYVVFHEQASSIDVIEAYYHYCTIEHQFTHQQIDNRFERVDHFEEFRKEIDAAGWITHFNLLGAGEWRIELSSKKSQ